MTVFRSRAEMNLAFPVGSWVHNRHLKLDGIVVRNYFGEGGAVVGVRHPGWKHGHSLSDNGKVYLELTSKEGNWAYPYLLTPVTPDPFINSLLSYIAKELEQ